MVMFHMIADNCEMTVRSKRQPIFSNAMNKHIESQGEIGKARAYTRATRQLSGMFYLSLIIQSMNEVVDQHMPARSFRR